MQSSVRSLVSLSTLLLFTLLPALTSGGRIYGQSSPADRFERDVWSWTNALERYEQIAPAIRCQDDDHQNVRELCRDFLERNKTSVADARKSIAQYHASRSPLDMFNLYQDFLNIHEGINELSMIDEHFGKSRGEFNEAYNTFVKLTKIDFPDEVRRSLQRCANRENAALDNKTH
jgi:hypothetical protein